MLSKKMDRIFFFFTVFSLLVATSSPVDCFVVVFSKVLVKPRSAYYMSFSSSSSFSSSFSSSSFTSAGNPTAKPTSEERPEKMSN
jgi:hypothetical protein